MAERLPFIQFYTEHWWKDKAVRMLSPAARGIWVDLLFIMHDSGRTGVVVGTMDMLARATGCTGQEMASAVNEYELCNTCDVKREDNGLVTLTNRRMAKEARERELAANRQETFRQREAEKAGNAPVTEVSPPISLESRKEGSDKASKRLAGGTGKPGLTPRQLEVAQLAESVLNGQWVNDAGKWMIRIRSNAEKVWRVMVDVKAAVTEGRIKTTPAQMAEHNWKVFA